MSRWMTAVVVTVFLGSLLVAGWSEHKYHWIDRTQRHLPYLGGRPVVDRVIPEAEWGHLAIYAFLGQSNAAGVAGNTKATLPAEKAQVYVFGNNYRWRRSLDALDDPRDQVDLVSIDQQYGYSAATAFASRMRQLQPQRPIGLLSCARGGSSISMWAASRTDTSLFGACYKRLLAASTAGHLAGIIFLQGERDAVTPARSGKKPIHPQQWAQRFTDMVLGLRQSLTDYGLPVVYGALGAPPADHSRFSGWDQVKRQQAGIAMPCVSAVSTDDLEKMPDGLHYTTRGFDHLGSKLADVLVSLQARGCRGGTTTSAARH